MVEAQVELAVTLLELLLVFLLKLLLALSTKEKEIIMQLTKELGDIVTVSEVRAWKRRLQDTQTADAQS